MTALQAFEKYISKQPNFNRGKVERHTWQDGGENRTNVFVLNAQMFTKRNPYNMSRSKDIPYELHPWIKAATTKSQFFPNPDRPTFFEISEQGLVAIENSDPPYITRGDLVWFSFTVEFVVGNKWRTVFTPCQFVRVATVSPELVGDPLHLADSLMPGDPGPEVRESDRLEIGQRINCMYPLYFLKAIC